MTPHDSTAAGQPAPRVRLAYLVSHPIQYQAPLLRRIAQEPGIDLTVLFGSDFSLSAYRDEGFGVDVAWDIPLLDGYRHEFLQPLIDHRTVSFTSPLSRNLYQRLTLSDGSPAFDALWIHGYASLQSIQALLFAKALGIPVLLRADSSLYDRPRSFKTLAAKKLVLGLLRRFVAATLPAGTPNAEYWAHYFGADFPQFLMPYAVDNEAFAAGALAAAADEPSLRAQLGLALTTPVVLFASKLQTRKLCVDLVHAFHQLLTDPALRLENPPALLIVGDGEERASLEALVRDRHIPGVVFAGFRNQTELPRYFQLSTVFVLPSRHEPWGLIVNEVMAAGLPAIVSSDVGAAPDLVLNDSTGYIYPVGNVAALAQALHKILSTPGKAAAMGHAAQLHMARWSIESNIAGLRNALAHTTRKLRP
jgi:glycosyltransferase involved in cell wall biosynthesis